MEERSPKFLADLNRNGLIHLRTERNTERGVIVVRNILGEEGPGGTRLDIVVDPSGDVTLAMIDPGGYSLGDIRFVNRAGGMITVAHELHKLAELLHRMKEASLNL